MYFLLSSVFANTFPSPNWLWYYLLSICQESGAGLIQSWNVETFTHKAGQHCVNAIQANSTYEKCNTFIRAKILIDCFSKHGIKEVNGTEEGLITLL